MITHTGEKVHKCAECGGSFGRAGNLKSHILTQKKETPHKCTQCDYACPEAGNLTWHMKTHSLQKPNECKWCEYSSITKSDLSRHLLTHSGERSWSHYCLECGRSFAKAWHFKTHLRIHTRAKSYKCTRCIHSSGDPSNLKQHMAKHPTIAH